MVCEGRQMQPVEDVFDEHTKRALYAAILRKIVSGDLDRGDMQLESGNPAIDGMTLVIPPEVAAA